MHPPKDSAMQVADDHAPVPREETWEIFEHLVPRCPNLRAVVFECERNPLPDNLPAFARIAEILKQSPSIASIARAGS